MELRCEAKDGPVWRVGLGPGDKPAVVLDPPGVEALAKLLSEAEAASHCRVLVFESVGEQFCRGMDLGFLVEHAGEDQAATLLAHARCMEQLRASSKTVICVVDGEAVGGGVGLAAAADLVLASPRASFTLPECVFGLIPAIVLPLLAERMPIQKARALTISGRKLSAAGAHTLGLVDELVDDPERLETQLRRILKQLLRISPRAVAELKRFSAELTTMPRATALERGAAQTATDLLEPETIAALAAFQAGELPPHFQRYRPQAKPPTAKTEPKP